MTTEIPDTTEAGRRNGLIRFTVVNGLGPHPGPHEVVYLLDQGQWFIYLVNGDSIKTGLVVVFVDGEVAGALSRNGSREKNVFRRVPSALP